MLQVDRTGNELDGAVAVLMEGAEERNVKVRRARIACVPGTPWHNTHGTGISVGYHRRTKPPGRITWNEHKRADDAIGRRLPWPPPQALCGHVAHHHDVPFHGGHQAAQRGAGAACSDTERTSPDGCPAPPRAGRGECPDSRYSGVSSRPQILGSVLPIRTQCFGQSLRRFVVVASSACPSFLPHSSATFTKSFPSVTSSLFSLRPRLSLRPSRLPLSLWTSAASVASWPPRRSACQTKPQTLE